ncbi:Uncharacterised protein [Mycobacteroides abscessus subsp. abscessus]|nr:Uncharacterised protein [Mycobacteroides abscessus subsp. abscessus]
MLLKVCSESRKAVVICWTDAAVSAGTPELPRSPRRQNLLPTV